MTVCVGLPVQPLSPSVSVDRIEAWDENNRPYSLGNPLRCGKGIWFKIYLRWQNCRIANIKITCGDHGTAKTLINVNVKLPVTNGSGYIVVKGQGNRPFAVDSILKACGYSCTSKQAYFCATARCVS